MGLDSYLFKRTITPKAKIIRKLSGGRDGDGEELAYWRKAHLINEYFLSYADTEDDLNCKDIILTKENLKDILLWAKEKECNEYEKHDFGILKKVLTKAIKETNFDEEEIYYYAWW